jgi:CubicO group peptidase (beta-lactamase class C family)
MIIQMNKRIWIPLLVVVVVLIVGTSQFPKLYIATGYGAKCMASGIFVAGRDPEMILTNDLDYSIVKYTRNKVDYQEKSVTTSLFGFARQKAIFREGFGCFLVDESDKNKYPVAQKPALKFSHDQSWKKAWPDGDLKSDTLFPEIDISTIQNEVDRSFDIPGAKVKRTAAIVVAYKGKLVAEQYWKEQSITPDTKIWGWSMDKSIVNAMIGVMVKQGKLSINAIAPVEEWQNDRRREITLDHLLHMSSGLKWNEDYGDISEATNMLYRQRNCYESAIVSPYGKKPGTEWKYSSGTTNILSGIIRNALKEDKSYFEFPYIEIFNKIGMTSMVLETDAHGYFVGSSYGYATARDWARFGQLYLQNGVWKGDSILPKEWVGYTVTAAPASKGRYGAQFWLNRNRELPDVPEDMFSCQGHRGQRIFIIPSRQLVVVRLGFAEDNFDYNQFLKNILNSLHR